MRKDDNRKSYISVLKCLCRLVLVALFAGPLAAQAAPPTGGLWMQTFGDEFEGSSLDTEKWNYSTGTWGGIRSTRVAANTEVGSGSLQLWTREEAVPVQGKDYTTGGVRAAEFRQSYGYWEARFRITRAETIDNAFWINQGWGWEIDIDEAFYPSKVSNNLHDGRRDPQVSYPNAYDTSPINLGDGFYTRGLEWTPTEVIYYFEGSEIHRQSHDFAHQPSGPILTTAIAGDWMGPIPANVDGTRMEVDWIRIYTSVHAWTDGSLNFGDTSIRNPEGRTLWVGIVNDTGGNLSVSGVNLTGADASDFQIVGDAPDTVAAGETGFFQLRFAPDALGVKAAQCEIATDYPSRPVTTLALAGNGVPGIIHVRADGDNGNSGLTWSDAVADPIEAYSVALGKGFNEIWIAGGTHDNAALTLSEGFRIYGGFAGDETALEQREAEEIHGANGTVLRPPLGDRVVEIEGMNDLRLDGLTFSGGRDVKYGGGAMRIVFGGNDTTISNCRFLDNSDDVATGKGGALYILGDSEASCAPVFENCVFSGNLSPGTTGGGAIYVGAYSAPTFRNCRIEENRTGSDYGGGVRVAGTDGYTVRFLDCTVSNNASVNRGGGLYAQGDVEMVDCLVTGNRVTTTTSYVHGGGGVYLTGSASEGRLERCVVSGNQAGLTTGGDCNGGGVYLVSGRFEMINCLVSGNGLVGAGTEHRGGGIYARAGSLTVRNCTIADNEAPTGTEGGGIATLIPETALRNTILSGNSGAGAATLGSGSLIQTTNLYYGNTQAGSPSGDPRFAMSGVLSVSGTWDHVGAFTPDPLSGRGTTVLTASGSPFANQNLVGTSIFPDILQSLQARVVAQTDSSLTIEGDAAEDWGLTGGEDFLIADYRPLQGGAAIDVAHGSYAPPLDLTGLARPFGSGDDIGAHEAVPSLVVEPEALFFTNIWERTTQSLTLYNAGTQSVGFINTSWVLDGADAAGFELVDPPPVTDLDPGETLELVVAFSPNGFGPGDEPEAWLEVGNSSPEQAARRVFLRADMGRLWFVDGVSGSDANGGASFADALHTIGAALALTQAGDAILVAADVYGESLGEIPEGVSVYGGFDIADTGLSDQAVDANATVIDLSGAPGSAALLRNPHSRVDGFTIKGGDEDWNAPVKFDGDLYDRTTVLSNCRITENNQDGGAVVFAGTPAEAGLVVGCEITSNTTPSRGAGLRLTGSGRAELRSTVLAWNHATIQGGAIASESSPEALLVNCLIHHNRHDASWGGAILHQAGSMALVHCTVADNTNLPGNLAQLRAENPTTRLSVLNSIIAGHPDNTGGRLLTVTTPDPAGVTIDSSLFHRRGEQAGYVYLFDSAGDVEFLNGLGIAQNNLAGDPRFVGIGDYRLQEESPALDAGLSAGAPDTDFDFLPRPAGRGYDIGAYEHWLAPSVMDTPSSHTVNEGSSITLTVNADGTAPLFYQWFRMPSVPLVDGAGLSGTATSTLLIEDFGTALVGTYFCRVWNAAGQIESAGTTLSINLRPLVDLSTGPFTLLQGEWIILEPGTVSDDLVSPEALGVELESRPGLEKGNMGVYPDGRVYLELRNVSPTGILWSNVPLRITDPGGASTKVLLDFAGIAGGPAAVPGDWGRYR